ncbi:MAG TPA: hypothetical protein VJO53_05875 [Candidatus Acidoferrales bacterium]|nr:hypothetical protein [Candidatus Acidoferrales bacterium]
MKHVALLLGAILVLTASVRAQEDSASSPLFTSAAPVVTAPATPGVQYAFLTPATGSLAVSAPVGDGAASSEPAAQQQPNVYGVFKNYNWQIYAGYSLFRFYVVPKVTETMNGLNFGMVYFLPQKSWIGVEGEFVGEYGSLGGTSSRFAEGMGGVRLRWSEPRGMELWAHGMVGGSHFLPQTAFGAQTAFAYEAGGGVDLGAHNRRIAYRIEADLVGTRYFSTYQYSPRVGVGIVFKF